MIKIKGQYNEAIIYTNTIDETTKNQIKTLLDQEFTSNVQIRIMPDCHAGAGCVIGTTMTIKDKIVPNLVGVDIGCGMLCINLGMVSVGLLTGFVFSVGFLFSEELLSSDDCEGRDSFGMSLDSVTLVVPSDFPVPGSFFSWSLLSRSDTDVASEASSELSSAEFSSSR